MPSVVEIRDAQFPHREWEGVEEKYLCEPNPLSLRYVTA